MQPRTKKKYVRKQEAKTQIYDRQTVREEVKSKNVSGLQTSVRKENKYVQEQNFDEVNFQAKHKTFQFQQRFNDYVRMSLIKLLPPKCKDIDINRVEQTMKGPPNQCQKLLKSIKNELQNFSMKMIKVQNEMQIDEIEFHLNPDYQVKVYRLKYVELSVNEMAKVYGFKDLAQVLINKMKNQNQILIRIKRQYSNDCTNVITELRKQKSAKNKSEIGQKNISQLEFNTTLNNSRSNDTGLTKTIYDSSDSGGSIKQEDNQPSYYQLNELKAKQQSPARVQKKQIKNKNKSVVNLVGNLSEPQEDDSVSVVGKKKKKYSQVADRNMKKKEQFNNQSLTRQKPKQLPKQKPKVQLKRYEFEGNSFDQKVFQKWLAENRSLQKNEVIIKKQYDPYNDDSIIQYTINLIVDQDLSMEEKAKKEEAIELYFKYKKVILFNLKNEAYKSQLIKEVEQSDELITVEYVKGYKSSKWPQNTMWRHIVRKDYTAEKKSANTQFFQAFFIQGIKDIVIQTDIKIREKIKQQPKQDVLQQIIFVMNELADKIRDCDKIKHLIKRHIEYIIEGFFKYACKIKTIGYILAGFKIEVLVKFDQQSVFLKTVKTQISEKLRNELKIQAYDCGFIIDRFTFQKLQKQVVILEKKEKGFTFLSSNVDMGNIYNHITSIISNINKISQKEIKQEDYLIGKKINQKIAQLQKQDQFCQVKFNSTLNKKVWIFKFYARGYLLDKIQEKINELKDLQINNRVSYYQILNLKQKQLLQDQEMIEKIHQKYNILVTPTDDLIDCRVNVVGETPNFKPKILEFKNTKSLDYTPLSSTIIFRSINELQNLQSSWISLYKNWVKKNGSSTPFKQKSRNYTIVLKQNQSCADMLKETLDANHAITQIVLVMPQYDKKHIILQIIRVLVEQKKYATRQLSLYFIEAETKTNFETILGIQQYNKNDKNKNKIKEDIIIKYYVADNTNLLYYSKTGNEKIIHSIKNNNKSVILNNQDLNITHNSHKFMLNTMQIVHLQSGKIFPVYISGNRVTFILNNHAYQMPPNEAIKVLQCVNLKTAQIDLSLGVYEIKFDTMQQINMFSGFVRKIQKEEIVVKVDKLLQQIQVEYNIKVGKLIYQYSSGENGSQNLGKVIKEVNDFIRSKVKSKQFSLKQIPNLTKDDIQKIKSEIQEDESIVCNYNQNDQSFIVKTYDDNEFLKVDWKLKIFENAYLSKNLKDEVKYPSFWQPQKQSIQQFIVPANTAEFNKVQDLFKVGKIKCLIRIQNQIIYKKYYQQGLFLKNLNDGTPVKTMQLFHGTKSTNPEEIYKDKEESFNINYSSDNNLLGRGIYFAQKSQYSNDYRHTQTIDNPSKLSSMFGNSKINTYSMFFCEVYVGQSQKCFKHNGNIKDTGFRDAAKKIRYQSMTDFLNNSNVYVVYKSRRAYPLYLIKY